MTQTTHRPAAVPGQRATGGHPTPRQPRPARTTPETARPRSALVAGLAGACWAAFVGLVAVAAPVLLVWMADSRTGAGAAEAARAAGGLWLLAHGTTLSLPDGPVGLTPLGLSVVPLLLLVRAGGQAARECRVAGPGDAAAVVGGIAAPYAVVSAVLAALVTDGVLAPAPVQALVGALLVAVLGAGLGVARVAGATVLPGAPRWLREVAASAGVALGVLLAAGALLVGVSLALHLSTAADVAASTGPGWVGGVALLLLGVLCVPNAAVWGAAWLSGPGVAVGAGTTVAPFAHELGAVPAFPLLAALPAGPAPVLLGVLAVVVSVGAGVLAGARLRPDRPGLTPARAVGRCAAVAVLVGVGAGVLCVLAGGPIGSGRLATLGPPAVPVGLAAAAQSALGLGLWVGVRWLLGLRTASATTGAAAQG